MNDELKNLEARLDHAYIAQFPHSAGWEQAALYMLLVFDLKASDSIDGVDNLKYLLMHALRWGKDAPSSPIGKIPSNVDDELFARCSEAFWRANEHVGICGAFIGFHRGIVEVTELGANEVVFGPNLQWQAYEVLDHRLHHQQKISESARLLAAEIGLFAEELITNGAWTDALNATSFPDIEKLRQLASRVDEYTASSYTLPETWSFDGISIDVLRRLWNSLSLLGIFRVALACRLPSKVQESFVRLICWPHVEWMTWMQLLSNVGHETIDRLIRLMTYDRKHDPPDPGLFTGGVDDGWNYCVIFCV